MSRKATPQDPNVAIAISRIRMYCDNSNIKINSLSKLSGVSQPALARFMSGERKGVTDVAKKVLAHINSGHNRHKWHNVNIDKTPTPDGEGYKLIESAIGTLWDGDPRTAELIATFIYALRPAIEVATTAIRERAKEDKNDY